jgi:hypothetical protein
MANSNLNRTAAVSDKSNTRGSQILRSDSARHPVERSRGEQWQNREPVHACNVFRIDATSDSASTIDLRVVHDERTVSRFHRNCPRRMTVIPT